MPPPDVVERDKDKNKGSTNSGSDDRPNAIDKHFDRNAAPSPGSVGDRPRTGGGNGGGNGNGGGSGGDPTKDEKGLMESAEEALDDLHKDIQEFLGGDPQNPSIPTERDIVPEGSHRRNPNDEDKPKRPSLKPAEEEEVPLIPGNPDDLGARGRRRRGDPDNADASPVLRRGLLGY